MRYPHAPYEHNMVYFQPIEQRKGRRIIMKVFVNKPAVRGKQYISRTF